MTDTELQLREAIIAQCRWMNATGLNQGTSGNISARCGETMLISPSATPYDTLTPDMIAAMPSMEITVRGRDRSSPPPNGAFTSTS